jgi:hypothetical protein
MAASLTIEHGPASGHLARGLTLLAGLALLFGLVATGIHDHARDDASHPCVICSLGHAPAAAPVVASAAAPVALVQPVVLEPLAEPRSIGPVSASSRAPPQT